MTRRPSGAGFDPDSPEAAMAGREVLLEFQALGHSVRVAAVDALTGEEVVFQAHVSTPRYEMDRLAQAKLARRLGLYPKKQRPGETPGRGIIV